MIFQTATDREIHLANPTQALLNRPKGLLLQTINRRMRPLCAQCLGPHSNTLMISLIGFESLVNLIRLEILARRPGNGPSQVKDSRVCILEGCTSPRDIHFVGTKCLAAIKEVLLIVFEIGVVGYLLDHPSKRDVGQAVGCVAATDRTVCSWEPALLQSAPLIVGVEVPECGGKRRAVLVQRQSNINL
jgi:hypothetical protein